MMDASDLASWMDNALATVSADVVRSRSLFNNALERLFGCFTTLQADLARERKYYETAVTSITGGGEDAGLARRIREILNMFVGDIVNIGRASVRILMEIETLRGHAATVEARGIRIEKIAINTHMISLNARIEARRVGSSGAVFRVIADEIKKLAAETRELSEAIRNAITKQSASLTETRTAASQLAAVDLDSAVQGHRDLEAAVAQLEQVSATSSRALDAIQGGIDMAIQALQFQDIMDQQLVAITGKLEAMRAVCGEVANGRSIEARELMRAADKTIERCVAIQSTVDAGAVEMF